MTAIYTTARIAHLIADGKVVQHRAPNPTGNDIERTPWTPGHSHPVSAPGRPSICRVIVHQATPIQIGDLQPRDLHDTGHRTRLALAQWWLRTQIVRQNRTGEPWTNEQILDRFEKHHADRWGWTVVFALDTTHEPRLLHEDPAQGYTHLPQRAATGEPEAVPAWDLERQGPAARQRHSALVGLIEQEERERLVTLEERLERVMKKAKAQGIDIRDEQRVLEQRIYRLEQKVARAA